MIATCQEFLATRLRELRLSNDLPAFRYGVWIDPEDVNVFFGELPRDYMKDHDLAAQCLPLQDRSQKDGRLIGRRRNSSCTQYVFSRRRYRREVLYRVLLYAPRHEDLWGTPGYVGLVDQLKQAIAAAPRVLADADNNAIRVVLQDAVRPWDASVETARESRRPRLGIVRVEFSGGIHTTTTVPIIPSVEIAADYQ